MTRLASPWTKSWPAARSTIGPVTKSDSSNQSSPRLLVSSTRPLLTNGKVALELALQGRELLPGSKIITTPFNFIATASAIVTTSLKPVFNDPPFPDPLRLMTLLTVNKPVGFHPGTNDRLPRIRSRPNPGRCLAWRRHSFSNRLTNSSPTNTMQNS